MVVSCKNFLLLLVIVFTILLRDKCGQAACTAFTQDNYEGLECSLATEGEGQQIIPCQHKDFSPGTVLQYRCVGGYKPADSPDYKSSIANSWRSSTCTKYGEWDKKQITTFSCETNDGYFDVEYHALIAKGFEVSRVSAPWNVAIFYNQVFNCGGTLINKEFILTAAHCLTQLNEKKKPVKVDISKIVVVLAATTSVYQDAVQDSDRVKNPTELYVHEGYVGEPLFDDIGLIQVQKVTVSEQVVPVKMPKGGQAEKIQTDQWQMQVNGLGDTSEDQKTATKLYGVNVTTKSPDCAELNYQKDKQICLAAVSQDSGICSGDSGGGAFFEDPPGSRLLYIQGIVSFGGSKYQHCFRAVVFTQVWAYMSWIKEITSKKQKPPPSHPINTPAPSPPVTPYRSTQSITQPPPRTIAPSPIVTRPTLPPPPPVTRPTLPPAPVTRPHIPAQPPVIYTDGYVNFGLNLHNQYRRQHQAPDLVSHPMLQEAAQKRAREYLQFYQLTPDSQYGFNAFHYEGPYLSDQQIINNAVTTWYNAITSYNWQYPPLTSTSTFTQLVWRSSKFLGIHLIREGSRAVVVATYSPKGNMYGEFQANVFPSGQTSAPQPTYVNNPVLVLTTESPVIIGNNWLSFGLSRHNELRQKHRVPPFTLDYQLSNEAQAYANYIIQSNYGLSPKPGSHGQNVYEITGPSLDPTVALQKAINSWYSGSSFYNFQYPLSSAPSAFLFTQLVWRSSSRLGLGVGSQPGRTVVIAFYDPPGNIRSEQSYRENVFPAMY